MMVLTSVHARVLIEDPHVASYIIMATAGDPKDHVNIYLIRDVKKHAQG